MNRIAFAWIVALVLLFVAAPVNAGCGPLGCAAGVAKAVGGKLKSAAGKVLGVQRRQARRAARGG